MTSRAHPLRCVPPDYKLLRDIGMLGIYGSSSNIVECAADVLQLLGHNMPPAEDP